MVISRLADFNFYVITSQKKKKIKPQNPHKKKTPQLPKTKKQKKMTSPQKTKKQKKMTSPHKKRNKTKNKQKTVHHAIVSTS